MKKLSKSWLIVILVISLSMVILLFVKQRKYSISEITADNYKELLSNPINIPIYNVSIDNIVSKGGSVEGLMFSNFFTGNSLPYGNNGIASYSINDGGDTSIEIRDKKRDLLFLINRKYGFPIDILVGKMYEYPTYNNSDALKSILLELITYHGFVLKKSNLIDGNDILIREEDKCFRIIEMGGKFEDVKLFIISSYSRNRSAT